MFVTAAVIRVKLLAVSGYDAFLHVSMPLSMCGVLHLSMSETETKLSGLNHHSCCACV